MPDYLPSNYIPSDNDILCGRGKIYSRHPGNIIFSETVLNSLQLYMNAHNRIARGAVVASIVKQFRSTGLRFIKLDKEKNQWFKLTSEAAQKKTGHAIRDLLKLLEPHALRTPKVSSQKQLRQSSTPSPTNANDTTRENQISQISTPYSAIAPREAFPQKIIAPTDFKIDDPLLDPFVSAQLLEFLSDDGRDEEKQQSSKSNTAPCPPKINDYGRPLIDP